MRLWTRLNIIPHENYVLKKGEKVDFQGAMVATWTDNFDCQRETEYWYCIKDNVLDLSAMKAKRRYEINKGNKNFTVKVINPSEYAQALYEVYVGSLAGYPGNPAPISMGAFQRSVRAWS